MGVSIVAIVADCLQTLEDQKPNGGAEIASILALALFCHCLDLVSQFCWYSDSELHHDIFHIPSLGLRRPHLWYILPCPGALVNRFA